MKIGKRIKRMKEGVNKEKKKRWMKGGRREDEEEDEMDREEKDAERWKRSKREEENTTKLRVSQRSSHWGARGTVQALGSVRVAR